MPNRTRRAAGVPAASPIGCSRACGSLITCRASDNAVVPIENRVATALPGEGPDVQVVDHLDDQVVEAFHQFDVGVTVSGDTQPGQHVLAELMGGDDRRRVETGQRRRAAVPA